LKGSSENNASSTGKGTGAALAAVGEGEIEADGVGLPAVFTFVVLTGSVEQPAATKIDKAINRPRLVFLNLLICDFLSMFLVARRCAILI